MRIAPEEVVVKSDISFFDLISRLLKNAHLRRSPHPSSLQRYIKRLVRLRIKTLPQERPKVLYSLGFRLPARSPASRSLGEGRRFGEGRGALYLDIFDHPYKSCFFSKLLEFSQKNIYDLYIIMNKEKQPKYETL